MRTIREILSEYPMCKKGDVDKIALRYEEFIKWQ